MSKEVKLFGHPVHQMLVVFPLGLLASSSLFDILYFTQNKYEFGVSSYYMLSAGLIGGLVAAVFGLADWLGIPPQTRAKTVGAVHGIGNVVVMVLFGVSWYLRNVRQLPSRSSLALSTAAAFLVLLTGWMGGELVNRMGIGVDRGAHPNAPSRDAGARTARPKFVR